MTSISALASQHALETAMNPLTWKTEYAARRPSAPAARRPAAVRCRRPELRPGAAGAVTGRAQAARANVKFSGHAQTRLASRNITLSGDDIARLGQAITKAAAKGARESLVLMDQAALVVSVPNRTVITAVDKSALKENIFTNIDSAMILVSDSLTAGPLPEDAVLPTRRD